MTKMLVLYKSKYGASKKYVDMMEKKYECDTAVIDQFDFKQIDPYDCMIVVGGIYASGIAGMKYIKKNASILSNKKIVIFAVGASPFDEKAFKMMREHNLKDIPFDIPMFYGRGAYDEAIMDFKDRTLCKLLRKSLNKKDKDTLEPWMIAFFEADGKSCDWTSEEYLMPLYEYIENYD